MNNKFKCLLAYFRYRGLIENQFKIGDFSDIRNSLEIFNNLLNDVKKIILDIENAIKSQKIELKNLIKSLGDNESYSIDISRLEKKIRFNEI